MPQPCSQPLTSNPFESYRDPITGQWKVKYPASALPVTTSERSQSVEETLKRVPKQRRWQNAAHTRVA